MQGLPREAQQIALDAVTAAWAGASAALSDVRALAAPWEAVLDPVPRGPDALDRAVVRLLRA